MTEITTAERAKVGAVGVLLGCAALAMVYLVTTSDSQLPAIARAALGTVIGLTAVVLASVGGRLVSRALWTRRRPRTHEA